MRRLPRRPTRRLSLLGSAALLSAFAGLAACQSQRITDTFEEADLGVVTEDLRRIVSPPDFRPPPDLLGPDVHVVITADNAYAFGWGYTDRVTKLSGRPTTTVAGDIFNCPLGTGPEEYDIPAAEAPSTAYIYIVAWADDATTQGVIGQFDRGGEPVYTGSGDWEVCATGLFYDSGPAGGGPPLEVVNQQIARCNAGQGDPATTSAGWVGPKGTLTAGATGLLVAGEDNSAQGGDFPIVCQKDAAGKRGVDAAARWMWYSPDGKSPFRHTGGHNPTRAFLIFRLPSKTIVIG